MAGPDLTKVVGVLLAGGRALRMGGGEKYLLALGGRTLLEHAIERARPQVARMVLNANADSGRLARFGLPVASDVVEGHAGPLAGVLTGMEWARKNAPNARWVATFATDCPFFPRDLVGRFLQAIEAAMATEGADLARAVSGGRPHPVFGLWPVELAQPLRQALMEEGVRKIGCWTARYRVADIDYPTEPVDPFFNVNRPEDLVRAEELLGKAG